MAGNNRYVIVPIVEGDGEVEAVPHLLNRWFSHRKYRNFGTTREAVRGHRGSMLAPYDAERETGIELYVRRAAARHPDGILVIVDADDDCLARIGRPPHEQIGPQLLQRAIQEVGHIPLGVVVANREFEAWFLAGFRRMRLRGQFLATVRFPENFQCEVPRDCKGRVGECLGRKYSPKADQKELVRHIGFGSYMIRYSRSFRKLLTDLERITQAARRNRRRRILQQRNNPMSGQP